MTTKEIAEKYQLKQDLFESFLTSKKLDFHCPLFGNFYSVEDDKVEQYVALYHEEIEKAKERVDAKAAEEAKKAAEEAKRAAERAELLRKSANIIISTTETLEGHAITKYVDCLSAEAFYDFNRSNTTALSLQIAMGSARDEALKQLRIAAYQAGCNAVVGVSFSYVSLAPESVTPTGGTLYQPYVVSVAANGTGVVVEKKN